jgi:hypothetical protein
MSGAQAGTGPLAGPPQGGIGVQTNEEMVNARRAATAPRTQVMGASSSPSIAPTAGEVSPPKDTGVTAPRDRDRSVTNSEHRTAKKVKKASKRAKDRAKHPKPQEEAQKAGS